MKSFRRLPFVSVLLVTNACVSPAPELMDNGPDTMEARDSGATDHPDSMGIEVTTLDVPAWDATLVDAVNDDRPTFDSIPVDTPTLDSPDSTDVPGLDVPNRVDIPNVVDVANPIGDTGVCPVPSVACPMAGCVDLQTDNTHCGACGALCPAVANGTAQCTVGACSAMCNAGFALLGGQCVVAGGFPRPIAPMSLGNVSAATHFALGSTPWRRWCIG